MTSEHYELSLDSDYVLGLFQAEVDKNTAGTKLERWTDVIMDWYEDQLEYGQIDWAINIPYEVRDDILFHKMIVVAPDDPHYDEILRLYDEEGCGCVDNRTDYVARILFRDYDNDGRFVYLCQQEL